MLCSQHRATLLSRHCTRRLLLRPGVLRWTHHPLCRSQATEENTQSPVKNADGSGDEKIKQTLADLDAILGIEEDDKAKTKASSLTRASSDAPKELLGTTLPVDADRLSQLTDKDRRLGESDGVITDQMKKILEKAKQLAEEQGKSNGNIEAGQQQQLRQEFEQLLTVMFNSESAFDKDDIRKLKESGVFGPMTFWVTEIRALEESGKAGILIRGNLRKSKEEIFDSLKQKVAELFGSKYEVLMIEDPEAMTGEEVPSSRTNQGDVRVAFQVVPYLMVQPPQTTGWKIAVALVLSLLLAASCGQLALVANITKLPKETLEFFARPDAMTTDVLPPGLEDWDPSSYFDSAAPVFFSLLGINFMHELGHRIAAAIKGVRLGPSYFIPNLQIGSFGAITPFTSLLKDRRDLWDVAAAGPLAGTLISLSLLVIGYIASDPAQTPRELLVPVPTELFQGSLLLGTLTKMSLGDAAFRGNEVMISPFTIAGWCGLLTNALNMLPVGSLDGGRMMLAAYGKQAHALSSFFTYVGLGLGFLGSSLSLPFGLYVLICQRTAEKYIQDSVTDTGNGRQIATAVAVLTAILILVPMAPELAESVGVGSDSLFL